MSEKPLRVCRGNSDAGPPAPPLGKGGLGGVWPHREHQRGSGPILGGSGHVPLPDPVPDLLLLLLLLLPPRGCPPRRRIVSIFCG